MESLVTKKKLNRREFLTATTVGLGLAAAGGVLAGCATPTAPAAPTAAPAAATAVPAAPTAVPAAPTASKGKAKITYMWPFSAAPKIQETVVKTFNDQSKNVEVELQVVPQEGVLPKMVTAFSGGAGPDTIAMSPAWIAQIAAAGWLENVEDRLKASGLEAKLLPVAMIQGRLYKNTAYMIGSVVDTYSLYYNKSFFTDAGLTAPPASMDDFAEYAKKMTDVSKNRYGYYMLAGTPWALQHWGTWMIGHGGQGKDNTFYDADGKCIFRGEKHIAGMQKWLDMYQKDKVTPEGSIATSFNDAAAAFNAGQIGMVMGFLGYMRNFGNAIGWDKYGVALQPAGPAGQIVHYGVNGYAMNSASKEKDAAWEFIQFLMTTEMQVLVNQEWGAVPAALDALNAEYLKHPNYQAPVAGLQMTEALCHTPRQLSGWPVFFEKFGPDEAQKALLGQTTATQFAEAVSTYLEDALVKG